MTHTPGPWINDAPSAVAKHWPEGGKATICMLPWGTPESEANARLIAAAPDLLVALKECADDLAALVEDQYRMTKDHPAMKSRYDRDMEPVVAARAAIAKATNGTGGES